ncbi:MAG: A24 family peptidase [Vicinamibacterales bacterium]
MPEGVALAAVLAGAGAGAAIDIRTRRIPNAVTFGTAALGLTLAATGLSGVSLSSSVMGLLLGLALMLPGRLFGATGAGDVKLMGAVGAVLGLERIVQAFLFTAIAGGLLAVGVSIANRRLGATVRRTGMLMTAPGDTRREIVAPGAGNRFAYGPAIAAGSLLAAML